MDRKCFSLLCERIISSVGEKEIKSEPYIDAFLKGKDKMYDANVCTTGGYIAGEVKLAVTLRLLAGGDALDLGVIFDISSTTITSILIDVLRDWIIKTGVGDINMTKYLGDKDAMAKVSAGFSKRSHGVLKGAIGAIDGWLVRIVRPGFKRDGIKNVTSFFSRKGFYALNVQCIVDDKKRVIWLSYKHKGGSHDSSCFSHTELYKHLHSIKDKLYRMGYFLLGDSAYALESFILVPYDGPRPQSAEDDFNFYHSSARITVECAFGEIDLRWGIFWKRLKCSLENAAIIIEGSMRLHNFLVDYRESSKDIDKELDAILERHIFEQGLDDSNIVPIVVGNQSSRGAGRPTLHEIDNRTLGLQRRDKLKNDLQDYGLHRPRASEWKDDSYSHVVRVE